MERPKRTSARLSQAKVAPANGNAKGPSLRQKTLFDSFRKKETPQERASSPASNASSAPVSIDIPEEEPLPPNTPLDIGASSASSPSVFELDSDDEQPTSIKESSPAIQFVSMKSSTDLDEGFSKDKPINLLDSPVAPLARQPHPFFAARAKSKSAPLPTPKLSKAAVKNGLAPPFPHRYSQHVRGSQTIVPEPSCSVQRRKPRARDQDPNDAHDLSFLKSANDAIVTIQPLLPDMRQPRVPVAEYPTTSCHERHSAIEQLANTTADNFPQSSRPWTDKWRPYCAQDVLGNEENALYLRSWLRALELQLDPGDKQPIGRAKGKGKPKKGIKRPRVIRTVDKSRKRAKGDDWIAYSDEEEEVPDIDWDALDPFTLSEELPLKDPLGKLHNTILLVGPHGSGKTASVYACAEELGWDVFEVYPGIGRRNGASVENLIGEVGKNHLVRGGIKASFGARGPEVSDAGYSPRKKSSSVVEERPVRQSLILLEEVDVLFKEDVNFWATVTRIIGECRRPVVCTCNDVSLVPTSDLPLQTILWYEACPMELAVPYLSAIAELEGSRVESPELTKLCNGSDDRTDLRQAINALQMYCLGTTTPETMCTGRESLQHVEHLSFLDTISLEQEEDCGEAVDDPSGHARVRSDFRVDDRQQSIRASVVGLARVDETAWPDDAEATRMVAGQVDRLLGELGIPERRPWVVVGEYLPAVRLVVAAEDAEAAEWTGTRRTRNSGYVRGVELTEEARKGLAMSNVVW